MTTVSLAVVLCVGVGAMVATGWLVAAVRRWAASRLLDVPNERSSHVRPTPRGGGIGIVAVVAAGVAFGVGRDLPPAVWAGGALLALVGLIDDWRPLPAHWRLGVHVLVAGIVATVLGAWTQVDLPLSGEVQLGVLGTLAAAVWLVGLVNAYNFMDGIDGMAALQAIVAGVAWLVAGRLSDDTRVAMIGALVAGGASGFLWHNWPPARIFMGDVGAVFLGYVFAVLPVVGAVRSPRLAVAGLLFVWPFVFDTAFTFARRLGRRENVFTAHRTHLYQRLNQAGWSHRSVSLFYAALAASGALLGLAYASGWAGADGAVLFGVPPLMGALLLVVAHAERMFCDRAKRAGAMSGG